MTARVMVGLGWKAPFVSLQRLATYSLLQGLDMGDGNESSDLKHVKRIAKKEPNVTLSQKT